MLIVETYECKKCGRVFMKSSGGFVFRISLPIPICPHCGSLRVIRKTK